MTFIDVPPTTIEEEIAQLPPPPTLPVTPSLRDHAMEYARTILEFGMVSQEAFSRWLVKYERAILRVGVRA